MPLCSVAPAVSAVIPILLLCVLLPLVPQEGSQYLLGQAPFRTMQSPFRSFSPFRTYPGLWTRTLTEDGLLLGRQGAPVLYTRRIVSTVLS